MGEGLTRGRLRIQGSGAVQPAFRLSSDALDCRSGRPPGWTEARFAIRTRAVAGPGETSSSLAAAAARAALDAAGWEATSLDVVVGACGVMEQPIPGTACLVQRRLGLGASGVPAFDVNGTCLSFLVALDVVDCGFAAGRWRRALIVSADIASAALNHADPEASAIFGDGAAAVVVEAVGDAADETASAVLAFRQETYGDDADLCRLEAGGTRLRPGEDLDAFMAGAVFRMDGTRLFKAAARRFPLFLERLLSQAGVSAEEIDVVAPHQASAAGLAHLRRAAPWTQDRIIDIFADHGNQIAASTPTALHTAIASGRLRRGGLALLVGTAAGLSLAGAVIRY